jgi:hypothetical protein
MLTGGLAIWSQILGIEILIKDSTFRFLLAISSVLFVIGVIFHYAPAGRQSTCGALLAPLPSLGLFRVCRKLFARWTGRDPKDTFLRWDRGLGPDQLFNVIYFILAFLLLVLTTIGMIELRKHGW